LVLLPRRKSFYLILFLLLLAILTLFSLLPDPPGPKNPVPGLDKAEHFLAWGVAGFFLLPLFLPGRPGGASGGGRKALLWVIVFASLYGGAVELIQPFCGRSRELSDLAADLLGAAAGGGVFLLLDRHFRFFSVRPSDTDITGPSVPGDPD